MSCNGCSGCKSEWQRPTVASDGCAYSTLAVYNQGYYGRGIISPTPAVINRFGIQPLIPPAVTIPGYEVLGGCVSSCGGYYTIADAYPSYPNNCGRYSSGLCG